MQKEDEVKNYAKFHGVSFDQWIDELIDKAGKLLIPMKKEELDLKAWKEFYDNGYAPGAALVEDITSGL